MYACTAVGKAPNTSGGRDGVIPPEEIRGPSDHGHPVNGYVPVNPKTPCAHYLKCSQVGSVARVGHIAAGCRPAAREILTAR